MKKSLLLHWILFVFTLLWLLFPGMLFPAAAQINPPQLNNDLRFTETGNRYANSVQFEAGLSSGKLFLHPDKFTFAFHEAPDHSHRFTAANLPETTKALKAHAYTVRFLGSQTAGILPTQPLPGHNNYFIGNDKNRWVYGAKSYRQVEYKNIYPGIDMRLLEQNQKLKYEFSVSAGGRASAIKMVYDGADKLQLINGNLVISTSVNTVTESKPYSYQLINGRKTEVASEFRLKGNQVSFHFPDGFDASLPLIIDPELIYSTYSGSSANNWGFTATYDSSGNIYSGGTVFNIGFPVTTGAYDLSFNGGLCDIGILKFDPSQAGPASLLYATYLGGTGTEAPHSLTVNSSNELLIYGTTGSADFPVTAQAYDISFAGGPSVTSPLQTGASPSHPNGVDMMISKLSGTGGNLLAATFIGGSGTDGLQLTGNPLLKNYGDQFRGDVITDAANNVYISASSSSVNFPVFNGFQPILNGPQDAVVCKLSPNLNSLLWSTFLGGSGNDAAHSIQLDSLNNVVVCGGTNSANFPVSANAFSANYNLEIDGFIARIAANGTVLQRATYLGTTEYDQAYFVQVDDGGNTYVLGQTRGVYPVSAGVYSVPNSRQFIHKFDYSLQNSLFSTTFGSVEPQINISPTAFLVNSCNNIYAAGWGGSKNAGYLGGSTNGMPVSANATQSTTDGSDFYLIALANDASSLLLATFFGEAGGADHSEGGTSRFDKNSDEGLIYQAVCASCAGTSNFPTTPNAWANTNGTAGTPTPACNNAVFKYKISELEGNFIPSEIPNGPRDTVACIPAIFHFRNEGNSGQSFLWNFGDGTTSVLPSPVSHSYPVPGIYPVSLTIIDSATCAISLVLHDTLYVSEPTGIAGPDTVMCMSGQMQLLASGGVSYSWLPAATLSATNIANPVASPTAATNYTVTITNAAGCQKIEVVEIGQMPILSIMAQTSICPGDSTQLTATPGYDSYTWTPATGLSATNIYNPIASPLVTTTYTVQVPEVAGCPDKAYVTVTVFPDPDLVVPPADTICQGSSVMLPASASPGYSFMWSPSAGLNNPAISSPVASPGSTTTYTVTVTSPPGCTETDTITVHVLPIINISAQAPICTGDTVNLTATPGLPFYSWTPATGLSATDIFNPITTPTATTTYTVYSVGAPGCPDSALVTVQVLELPSLTISPPATICAGDSVQLMATATPGYDFTWSPGAGLNDSNISNPIATPMVTTTYNVTVANAASCPQSASVTIQILPSLQVNGPHTLCPGQSAQLEASPGLASYTWWPSAGLSAVDIFNPVAAPDSTTTYTVHASGVTGCPDTAYVTVTISPEPELLIFPPNGPVCAGDSVQLSAAASLGYSVNWSPASGLSNPAIANPVASPSATTTYTVTATNAVGCSETDTVTVEVVPLLSVTGPGPVCLGQNAPLEATPGLPSYSWTPVTGLSSTIIHNPVATPDSTTTYTVYTNGTGTCPNMALVTVTVSEPAGLSPSPTPTLCAGDSVQLLASANPGFGFAWSPAFGLSNPAISNPVAFPVTTTTYTVTVTDSAGCAQSDTVTVQVIPLLTVTGQAAICAGESTQLSATPSLSGYVWSPATGLSATNIENPVASPDSTTTYTVQTTGSGNCPGTAIFTVTVVPEANLTVSQNVVICTGSSTVLQAAAAAGFALTWSPVTGLSNSNTGLVTASPGSTTLYTVTALLDGCSAEDTVRVTVNESPAANAGPDAGLCIGDSTQIGFTGQPGVTYLWSPATGLDQATQPSTTATPVVTTTYTLTAVNASGCQVSDTVTVAVNAPPLVQMPENTTICAGSQVQLSVTGSSLFNYSWSPSATLSDAGIASPIATPGATTTYTLHTEIQGCGAMQQVTVNVLPGLVALASADALICPGQNTALSVSPYPGIAYSWWPAGGLNHTDSAIVLATPLQSTTYFIQLTSVDGCTALDSVTINLVPEPVIAVTPAEPHGIEPLPVTFSNQSSGGSSYFWDLGNSTSSSVSSPSGIYFAGTYPVVLTTTYGPGCTQTDTVAVVRVVPPMAPNIITPNGDGKNDVFVALLTNSVLHLRIYNRWGVLLYEKENYQNDWGANGLTDGLYYYELTSAEGQSWKGWLEVHR